MRPIPPVSPRIDDDKLDRVFRNHDERIKQLVREVERLRKAADVSEKKMLLGVGGLAMSSAGAHINYEITAGFDWRGRFKATGVGDIVPIPLPLCVGDKIKSLTYRYYGGSTATKRFSLISIDGPNSGLHTVLDTDTAALSGHNAHRITPLTQYEVTEGFSYFAQFRSGVANDRFYSVELTYIPGSGS